MYRNLKEKMSIEEPDILDIDIAYQGLFHDQGPLGELGVFFSQMHNLNDAVDDFMYESIRRL